jgi:nucleotide-binding universal stress UspA family protein
MMRNVTVCVDGSDSAEAAFHQAADLAKALGAPLHILTVAPPAVPSYLGAPSSPSTFLPDEEVVRYHSELAQRFVARAKERGLSDVGYTVMKGHAVEQILDHLDREPADVLVVGARGLSRFQRLLLGSVSSALVQYAKCSVLVVKGSVSTSAKSSSPKAKPRNTVQH